MAPKKLRVDLYVCPDPGCSRIGKAPLDDGATHNGYCIGPIHDRHKKRRMELRRFVEERSPRS